MTTVEQQIDGDKLMAFVFRAVDEVGATLNAALVVMGDKLGYYRALAGRRSDVRRPSWPSGPSTSEHYAREWLNAQAAGGFVEYDPTTAGTCCRPSRRSRSPTRAARRSCPASSRSRSAPCKTPARRSRRPAAAPGSAGTSTTPTYTTVASGSSGPGYNANLLTGWLPALDGRGRQARTRCAGGRHRLRPRRLDDPDGEGVPAVDASSAPTTTRRRSRSPGSARPRRGSTITFEVARRDGVQRNGLRPGDHVRRAARHGRPGRRRSRGCVSRSPTTAPGWSSSRWPATRVEDNLNPVGRAYYGFSTLLCTPASLSQDVGLALGTQAGPARIRDVTTAAGFTRFRVAAETPFNLVYEVRP